MLTHTWCMFIIYYKFFIYRHKNGQTLTHKVFILIIYCNRQKDCLTLGPVPSAAHINVVKEMREHQAPALVILSISLSTSGGCVCMPRPSSRLV